MRRLVLLLILVALALAYQARATSPSGTQYIAVLPQSLTVSVAVLQADLPAFNAYAEQVCAAWHCRTPVLYVAYRPKPGEWSIAVRNLNNGCSCQGYHTTGPHPHAYVFAGELGLSWEEVFTHEEAELLVDSNGLTTVQVAYPYQNGDGGFESPTVFYAQEVADPVMGHTYNVLGMKVADFVTPAWFVPKSRGPFDAARATAAPLTLLPFGYIGVFSFGQWKELYGR